MSLRLSNEIIPSVILFFAALITSFYTYTSISNDSSANRTIAAEIHEGKKIYNFIHNSSCFGEVDYSFESQNNIYSMYAKGSIDLSVDSNTYSPNFEIDATFNSIGQLGGSLFRLTVDNSYFSIGTSGIDPINLKIRIKYDQNEDEKNFSINGPIYLIKQKDGTYRIEVSQLQQLKNHSNSLFGPALSFFTNIKLEERKEPLELCSKNNRRTLDLTAHAKFLSIITSQLLPLAEKEIN